MRYACIVVMQMVLNKTHLTQELHAKHAHAFSPWTDGKIQETSDNDFDFYHFQTDSRRTHSVDIEETLFLVGKNSKKTAQVH